MIPQVAAGTKLGGGRVAPRLSWAIPPAVGQARAQPARRRAEPSPGLPGRRRSSATATPGRGRRYQASAGRPVRVAIRTESRGSDVSMSTPSTDQTSSPTDSTAPTDSTDPTDSTVPTDSTDPNRHHRFDRPATISPASSRPSGLTSSPLGPRSRQMRERAEALFATGGSVSGDPFAAESLGRQLARRIAELTDDPTAPLFFGRLDFGTALEDHAGRSYHIGRRHVVDDIGEPLVLDWRAPISRSFYRASVREPQGVAVRRRFGWTSPGTATTGCGPDHRLRGRAPRSRRGTRHEFEDPDLGNRTPSRRTDARHRRDDPARAGRTGPRRPRHDDLRTGCTRHRKDRGRSAPCRVPALRCTASGFAGRACS